MDSPGSVLCLWVWARIRTIYTNIDLSVGQAQICNFISWYMSKQTFENLEFHVILSTAKISHQQLVVTISTEVLQGYWIDSVVRHGNDIVHKLYNTTIVYKN